MVKTHRWGSGYLAGANFGTILGGALIGAAAGAVGAGVTNVVAGGSFVFTSQTAITTMGFAGGFAAGFVGALPVVLLEEQGTPGSAGQALAMGS